VPPAFASSSILAGSILTERQYIYLLKDRFHARPCWLRMAFLFLNFRAVLSVFLGLGSRQLALCGINQGKLLVHRVLAGGNCRAERQRRGIQNGTSPKLPGTWKQMRDKLHAALSSPHGWR
jgi:hypothetical protein